MLMATKIDPSTDSDSDEDAQIEYDRYDDRVMTGIEHRCNTDMTAIAQRPRRSLKKLDVVARSTIIGQPWMMVITIL